MFITFHSTASFFDSFLLASNRRTHLYNPPPYIIEIAILYFKLSFEPIIPSTNAKSEDTITQSTLYILHTST